MRQREVDEHDGRHASGACQLSSHAAPDSLPHYLAFLTLCCPGVLMSYSLNEEERPAAHDIFESEFFTQHISEDEEKNGVGV